MTPMKTNLACVILVAALSALGLAGCSTPATRIKANPEVYERLTPQQQALVQSGQIALGFDAEAVKLALGDPDRISVRTDADGETAIWHYVTYEAEGQVLFSGYYHTGRRWGWWGPSYAYYLDYPNRRERDRFCVELKHDIVTAITEDRSH
jgi:hypothetical protein